MSLRVVVVDDSEIVRAVLTEVLQADGDIAVVGFAGDGESAIQCVQSLKPDLVTLDLSMPGMNGLTTLATIMETCPVPVLVVTGEPLGEDAQLAFEAVQRGAVDLLPKAAVAVTEDNGARFREQVRAAAATPVFAHRPTSVSVPSESQQRVVAALQIEARAPVRIVGFAAGKGGAQAVTRTLGRIPRDAPCSVLLVQPIPPGYEPAYAKFLRGSIDLPVVLVTRDGADLAPGTLYMAGEDAHLVLASESRVKLDHGPRIQGFRPSADVLFRSMATRARETALGVVVSGRGTDGAAGLRDLRAAGGATLIERPETATPSDMPKAAEEHAERAVDAQLLADAIIALAKPTTRVETRRPPAPSTTGARRIYLLDDSILILEATRHALEYAGYEVATASTIGEFEGLLAAGLPDLIVMDVDMPEMYGHDVATVLRQVRDVRVPIYLFSSFDKKELAPALRAAPVDGYFQKSEGVGALVEGVRAALEAR